MSEKLQVKNPIYPVAGIVVSLIVLIVGMAEAKSVNSYVYLAAMWALFLCFGYWKACLSVLPIMAVFAAVFGGLTYAFSHKQDLAIAMVSRIVSVCVAVVPGLGLAPVKLMRNLSGLKVPRTVTLGMTIALSFFPLLAKEVRQVREAMRTRGAGSWVDPRIFYRAFMVPFVMRLVNISDTLALSVETRGFKTGKAKYTIYKPVKFQVKDAVFIVFALALAVAAVAVKI